MAQRMMTIGPAAADTKRWVYWNQPMSPGARNSTVAETVFLFNRGALVRSLPRVRGFLPEPESRVRASLPDT